MLRNLLILMVFASSVSCGGGKKQSDGVAMYASSLDLIFKDMMTTAQTLLEYAALAETAIEAEAGGESEETEKLIAQANLGADYGKCMDAKANVEAISQKIRSLGLPPDSLVKCHQSIVEAQLHLDSIAAAIHPGIDTVYLNDLLTVNRESQNLVDEAKRIRLLLPEQ